MSDIIARALANKALEQLNVLTDSGAISGFQILTQAEYDALPAPDETVLYFIIQE